VTHKNYEFEVLEMDNRRIVKVKFTIRPVADEQKAEQ
jgi:CBS domain containing-hemolysin-like protein